MSIWKTTATPESLNQRNEGNMCSHVGIKIVEIGDDFIRGTMPVDERTKQPAGLLHGGASVVLAETLGSVAANLCCEKISIVSAWKSTPTISSQLLPGW